MNDLNRPLRRAATTLFTALALAACQLPTKIGDLPDSEDDATGPTGDSSGALTEADSASDSGDLVTTSDTATDATGEPFDCAALDELACLMNPECVPLVGQPDLQPGCNAEFPEFVICHDKDLDCPEGKGTVCVGESLFYVDVTCKPPGVTDCEGQTPRCGATDCTTLDEQECIDFGQGCKAIYGHPHVTDADPVCVDYDASVFLGCIEDTGACPPFVPTVCAPGALDQPFDVPAGCTPSEYVDCGVAGTAACR